ncbi:hypothetical protein AVEN_236447-1 [Araneus ventricosus]|uniref:Reverse transcriptase domain-containing protein n=1 Tax=Araneus ventricosus TaxID=182803 RepID=A0A4Y2IUI1_ARAVE|nr:hypothetical protein AVEN_236447-1 [Araneus ventricosus]
MTEVLKRAEASNIEFNANKLQFRMTEVKYMSQIISDKGVKADPRHIKSIVDMPTPSSKGESRALYVDSVNCVKDFTSQKGTTTTQRYLVDELLMLMREDHPYCWID